MPSVASHTSAGSAETDNLRGQNRDLVAGLIGEHRLVLLLIRPKEVVDTADIGPARLADDVPALVVAGELLCPGGASDAHILLTRVDCHRPGTPVVGEMRLRPCPLARPHLDVGGQPIRKALYH